MRNSALDIPRYLVFFKTYLGRRLYLVFALTLFAGLAEGVGILMLLPLLQSLGGAPGHDALNTGTASSSGISAHIHQVLSAVAVQDSTVAVLLIITTAFIIKGALTFGALGYSAYLRGQLLRELKGRLFHAYRHMSYGYYSSRDTGHFVNIINEQCNRAHYSFFYLTRLATQAIYAIVYVALAFAVAWRFGLMALGAGLALLVLFRWLNAYVSSLSRKWAEENGRLASLLIQTMHAFKYLTATDQIPSLDRSVRTSIGRLVDYEMRSGIAEGFTQAVREPIAVVFIMLIVLVQLIFLDEPLAPILISIALFYRGVSASLAVQTQWQFALQYIGSLELVRLEFAILRENQEPNGDCSAPPLDRGVSMRDVFFSYDPQLDDVIKGVSLEIPVRTSIALVGESGSGKSTLVDLLTLMLKPRQGQVLIDDLPGDAIQLGSWRRQIGYVSQETVIFDDSIANNICMWEGDPKRDPALMERVREATRQAHLTDYVDTMPQGYDTLVGDRGVRLSGGQRQRLFIARELFRKPNLLILDEATSALDSGSERAIQRSIDSLKGQITVVIIAHRLATIRNVDHVYVFDQGRLVEDGSYEHLRDAEDSRFGKLVAQQAL